MTKVVGSPVLMQRALLATFGLWIVWIALVGNLDPVEWAIGGLIAFATAAILLDKLVLLDGVRVRPGLPIHLARYFVRFGRALVLSNIDVARRVAMPGVLRIRPALVEIHTELQSDLGRLWLANSITLTPGTLTVDIMADKLTVHWIDAPPNADLAAATREIAADFEAVLKEIVR